MKKENGKAAKAGDEKRITLELNTNLEKGSCCFCGAPCVPDGLDFFLDGTKNFVCTDCVKEKAPDLYLIHEYAHRWRENEAKSAWHKGEKAEKEAAGRIILAAMEEPAVDRVRRVCRLELGVVDED